MQTIRALRAMGATRVRVGDIEATFGPDPEPELPSPRPQTEDEKRAEEERLLFHSSPTG